MKHRRNLLDQIGAKLDLLPGLVERLRFSFTRQQQTSLEALRRVRAGDPDSQLLKSTLRELHQFGDQYERAEQRRKGRRPRKRGQSPQTELKLRGLRCVLKENPNITAETLREMLGGRPLTYDADETEDVQLRLVDDVIIIRDLGTNLPEATIKITSLRQYLARARNS